MEKNKIIWIVILIISIVLYSIPFFLNDQKTTEQKFDCYGGLDGEMECIKVYEKEGGNENMTLMIVLSFFGSLGLAYCISDAEFPKNN